MFGEKIKALQALIATTLDKIEQLQTAVEKEDRGFSDDESEQRKTMITEVKSLQGRVADLEETEALMVSKAEPVSKAQGYPATPAAAAPVAASGGVAAGSSEKHLDLFYAKQAHALYVNGGSRLAASEYAKETLNDDLLSKTFRIPQHIITRATVDAGQAAVTGWAAELVQINQAASAFIELLRPMSVVARFPGTSMTFDGNGSIKIPRQTVGSTGTWIGEGKAIKVDRLTLDEVTLAPKKNANIITSSNELLARSDPSAMGIIRDDILKGIAVSIDTSFVDNNAASATRPPGLQTFDGTPTVSGGGTLDQITADLKTVMNAMLSINMPMVAPVWLMNPANVNTLRFIRDGLGTYAFKDELASGTLMGYPVLESTTVPLAIVMLADASQIILASELAPEISISEDASLHMEDTSPSDDLGGATSVVASMFQLDMVAIRAKTTMDWNARYAECVQVINGVSW